jgi:hypothetical protein
MPAWQQWAFGVRFCESLMAGAATTIADGIAAGGLKLPPAALKTARMIATEPIRGMQVPGQPEARGREEEP